MGLRQLPLSAVLTALAALLAWLVTAIGILALLRVREGPPTGANKCKGPSRGIVGWGLCAFAAAGYSTNANDL
jgi:hypothetical protein